MVVVSIGSDHDDGGMVAMDDVLSAFETALVQSTEAPPPPPPAAPSFAAYAAKEAEQAEAELLSPAPPTTAAPVDSRDLVDLSRIDAMLVELRAKSTLALDGFTRAELQLLLKQLDVPALVLEFSFDFDAGRDHDLGLFIRTLCRDAFKAAGSKVPVIRLNSRLNPLAGSSVAYGEIYAWLSARGIAALSDRFWYAPGMGGSDLAGRVNLYQNWAARPLDEFTAPEIDLAATMATPMLDTVAAPPPPPPPKPSVRKLVAENYDREKIRYAAKSALAHRFLRVIDFSQRELQLLMGPLTRPLLTVEMNVDGDNPAIGQVLVQASETVAQAIADGSHGMALTLVINQPENNMGVDLQVGEMRVRLFGAGSRPLAENVFIVDATDMHRFAAARATELRGWILKTRR